MRLHTVKIRVSVAINTPNKVAIIFTFVCLFKYLHAKTWVFG